MNMARCLTDGSEWTVQEFSQKDQLWQGQHRKQLVCLGCSAPAVFRCGPNKKPSFAARHRPDCPLTAHNWSVFKFLAA
jgi:hypothetical protein